MPAKSSRPNTTPAAPGAKPAWESKWVRLVVLGIVLVAAVGVAVVLLRGHHKSQPATTQVTPIPAVGLDASGLKSYATALNQVIYWAGPRKGYTYELTRTANNWFYVRYLPPLVKVGTRGKYLTIATYPLPGALASLTASTSYGKPLAVVGNSAAIARVEKGKATNVYVAYPGIDLEIEVYAPKPSVARAVATSGALQPVP